MSFLIAFVIQGRDFFDPILFIGTNLSIPVSIADLN
jgi:hypothetical protein